MSFFSRWRRKRAESATTIRSRSAPSCAAKKSNATRSASVRTRCRSSFVFCFFFFFVSFAVKKTNDGFAFSRALALPSFYRVVEMLEIVGFTCHRFFILFCYSRRPRRGVATPVATTSAAVPAPPCPTPPEASPPRKRRNSLKTSS